MDINQAIEAEKKGATIQFRTRNHFGKTIAERNEYTKWTKGTTAKYLESFQYEDTEFRIEKKEQK